MGQKKAFHNPYFNNSANAFPRHQLSETQTKKASAFNPDTPRDKMIRCKMLCGNNTCGQRSRRLMRASAHIAMSGILSVQIGLPRAVVEAGEGGPPNPIKVLFSPRGIYLKDEDKGDAVFEYCPRQASRVSRRGPSVATAQRRPDLCWKKRPTALYIRGGERGRLGLRYRSTAGKRLALCVLREPITHSRARCLLYELNVLIHGLQKHESSVHIILVYGQRVEPTPSYLRAACPISTLHGRGEQLWDTRGTPGQSKTRGYLICMEFY